MAQTPRSTDDSPAAKTSAADKHAADEKAKEPPKAAVAGAAPEQQHAVLTPENALALFRNGHRIAKDGDPAENWISMGRAIDGVELYQQPLTQELIDQITGGAYYLIDDQAYLTPGA